MISGQFLIDSEANLQGILDKLNTGQPIASSQTIKRSTYQGLGKVEKSQIKILPFHTKLFLSWAGVL